MRARDGVSGAAALAAMAVAVLAIGSADRWAQMIVATLVAVALIPQLRARRVLTSTSPLIALAGIAALLTAIQLIPMPSAITDTLDPTGSGLRDDGAALLGLHPWHALTLDAPATLRALAFFMILLAFGALALRASVTERGRYRVLAAVAILCAVVAVIIGVHTLFGITKLYGVYEVKQAKPSVLGPLLNENHLGCLMAVGTITALGLLLYRQQTSGRRVAWLIIVCMCGVATVASQSRGAALALIAGALVALGVRAGQRLSSRDPGRHRGSAFSTRSLPIALIAACTVIVIIYASAGGVVDQLSRTHTDEIGRPKSKFMAMYSATKLIEETPWIGVGRGALEPALTRVHPASSVATYAYVENEYVQAAVDWGLPGTLALGAVMLWLVIVAIRRWRDGALAAGALGAFAVVLIQSNVDFGIELLGVAVPITCVVATLVYVPVRETDPHGLAVRRGLRALHVAALAGSAVLLALPLTTSIFEDHEALAARRHPTVADLTPALDRHPLDYYGYALAAEALARSNDPRAVRVLNHALTLHPTHSGLHLYAGRLLYRAGRIDQAAIEYASAIHGTAEPKRIIEEAIAAFPPAIAAQAIPIETARIDEFIGVFAEVRRPDIALLWLGRVLDQGVTSHGCELLYALALDQRSVVAIETAVRRCSEFEPTRETRAALAALLVRDKAWPEAIQIVGDVDTWDGMIDLKRDAWLTLCDAHIGLAHWDDARRCLHHLEASGALDDAHLGAVRGRLDTISAALATPSGSGQR